MRHLGFSSPGAGYQPLVGTLGFRDRADAGRQLAGYLEGYANRPDVLVLGLARGGVPVAFEVADALGATLDVFLVRKLGVPGHEELAMGAIASGGVRVMNDEVLEKLDLSKDEIASVAAAEQHELERRERDLREGAAHEPVEARTAILVDDGLATGASMRAAVLSLRSQDAGEVVVAVPVASPDACAAFEGRVEEIVCVRKPEPMGAVGIWYDDFSQTTDEEVRELLAKARASAPAQRR